MKNSEQVEGAGAEKKTSVETKCRDRSTERPGPAVMTAGKAVAHRSAVGVMDGECELAGTQRKKKERKSNRNGKEKD